VNRLPTDREQTILAIPVAAAIDEFADPSVAMLAIFTLGLDFGRKDPALAARMSEIGQSILTGGGSLDEDKLDASIALANLLFIIADAEDAVGA
jgi:hypothetical protein